jgi:acetyltransferase-like isoleucine patch superfamily enzyme
MGVLKIFFSPFITARRLVASFINRIRRLELSVAGVKIGADCFISSHAYFDTLRPGLIEVGDNCMITRGCIILSHSDAYMGGPRRIWTGRREFKRVKIGNNVYIGIGSVVMPGVTIGDNVIIGAKSFVTKDIPPNSVAIGVPTKIVRALDVDELRKQRSKSHKQS